MMCAPDGIDLLVELSPEWLRAAWDEYLATGAPVTVYCAT